MPPIANGFDGDDEEELFKEGTGDIPAEKERSAWRWLHMPEEGVVHARLLVPRPRRYRGHYYNRQVWVCPGSDCALCGVEVEQKRKLAFQMRYVYALLLEDETKVLLETGWQTAEDFEAIEAGAEGVRCWPCQSGPPR